eukprot:symbB.v1.2.025641.t1/scaffold2503.1/size77562/2
MAASMPPLQAWFLCILLVATTRVTQAAAVGNVSNCEKVVDNETCVLADNKCHVEWPGGELLIPGRSMVFTSCDNLFFSADRVVMLPQAAVISTGTLKISARSIVFNNTKLEGTEVYLVSEKEVGCERVFVEDTSLTSHNHIVIACHQGTVHITGKSVFRVLEVMEKDLEINANLLTVDNTVELTSKGIRLESQRLFLAARIARGANLTALAHIDANIGSLGGSWSLDSLALASQNVAFAMDFREGSGEVRSHYAMCGAGGASNMGLGGDGALRREGEKKLFHCAEKGLGTTWIQNGTLPLQGASGGGFWVIHRHVDASCGGGLLWLGTSLLFMNASSRLRADGVKGTMIAGNLPSKATATGGGLERALKGMAVSLAQCPAGHAGAFCASCPIGQWGDGNQCYLCCNKPKTRNAIYKSPAWPNRTCPFQCVPGVPEVIVNPNCLSHYDFAMGFFGGKLVGDQWAKDGLKDVMLSAPWNRTWKNSKNIAVAPNLSEVVTFFARVPKDNIERLLKTSGENHIYAFPRADPDQPPDWLAAFGVRVCKADFVAAWKEFRPDVLVPDRRHMPFLAKVKPFPHGTTHDDIVGWLNTIKMEARPLKSLGPDTWLIAMVNKPKIDFVDYNGNVVLFKLLDKNKPQSAVVLAGTVPQPSGQAQGNDDPWKDWNDPWSDRSGGGSRPKTTTSSTVSRVIDPPIASRFQQYEDQLDALKTSITTIKEDLQASKTTQKQDIAMVNGRLDNMDANLNSGLQTLANTFEQSLATALSNQDRQMRSGFDDLKNLLEATSKIPSPARVRQKTTHEDGMQEDAAL